MKKIRIGMILSALICVILESMPFGVRCTFMDDGGVEIVRTYAYFDMTPYAYGNLFPFIAAVLSGVILILCIVYYFRVRRGQNIAIIVLAAVAALVSVVPFFVYLEYTIVGVLISVFLILLFMLSLIEQKSTTA